MVALRCYSLEWRWLGAGREWYGATAPLTGWQREVIRLSYVNLLSTTGTLLAYRLSVANRRLTERRSVSRDSEPGIECLIILKSRNHDRIGLVKPKCLVIVFSYMCRSVSPSWIATLRLVHCFFFRQTLLTT